MAKFRDAIGQEIKVSDYLFYGQSTGRLQAYGVVEVLGFTAAKIRVKWVKCDRYYQDKEPWLLQAFDHCVVITQMFNDHPFTVGDRVYVPVYGGPVKPEGNGVVRSVDRDNKLVYISNASLTFNNTCFPYHQVKHLEEI